MVKKISAGWIFRAFGPAIVAGSTVEALRAGLGALIGLGAVGYFLLSPMTDLSLGLYLIAPFGATSVLLFAVPNSPLAQPWSAIVGNTSAAVVGVAVCLLVKDPVLCIALAVGLAIALMIPLRAVHPPAGAVAMTAAMNPGAIGELGFQFALAPVAAGTAMLVAIAILYARLTGRHYPFRQFEETGSHGTSDPPAIERLHLSEDELGDILRRYRQSLNLGVEDLARLVGAAEIQAATHRTGPLTASAIMSTDLVTVSLDSSLNDVANIFRRHGFTSLPVVRDGDRFLGVIFQLHLIRSASDDVLGSDRSVIGSMRRLISRGRREPLRAGDIMAVDTPQAAPETPIAALLPPLAEEGWDAVPIVHEDRIVGIVTRTDLIAALARQSLLPDSCSRSTRA